MNPIFTVPAAARLQRAVDEELMTLGMTKIRAMHARVEERERESVAEASRIVEQLIDAVTARIVSGDLETQVIMTPRASPRAMEYVVNLLSDLEQAFEGGLRTVVWRVWPDLFLMNYMRSRHEEYGGGHDSCVGCDGCGGDEKPRGPVH